MDLETSPVSHFSQANPIGPGMADAASLLRRVAATIDSLGEICVHDVVAHTDVLAGGYQLSLTVYYSADPADVAASRGR